MKYAAVVACFENKDLTPELCLILGILRSFLDFARQLKSLTCLMFVNTMIVSGANNPSTRSIGSNFTANGNWSGLNDNAEAVSPAPSEVSGIYSLIHIGGLPAFAIGNSSRLGCDGSVA